MVQVARGKGGEPFGVGVSEDWIYWTDWSRHASWRIHKQDKSRLCSLAIYLSVQYFQKSLLFRYCEYTIKIGQYLLYI